MSHHMSHMSHHHTLVHVLDLLLLLPGTGAVVVCVCVSVKRGLRMVKETYYTHKRDLLYAQKRPFIRAKEATMVGSCKVWCRRRYASISRSLLPYHRSLLPYHRSLLRYNRGGARADLDEIFCSKDSRQ